MAATKNTDQEIKPTKKKDCMTEEIFKPVENRISKEQQILIRQKIKGWMMDRYN